MHQDSYLCTGAVHGVFFVVIICKIFLVSFSCVIHHAPTAEKPFNTCFERRWGPRPAQIYLLSIHFSSSFSSTAKREIVLLLPLSVLNSRRFNHRGRMALGYLVSLNCDCFRFFCLIFILSPSLCFNDRGWSSLVSYHRHSETAYTACKRYAAVLWQQRAFDDVSKGCAANKSFRRGNCLANMKHLAFTIFAFIRSCEMRLKFHVENKDTAQTRIVLLRPVVLFDLPSSRTR